MLNKRITFLYYLIIHLTIINVNAQSKTSASIDIIAFGADNTGLKDSSGYFQKALMELKENENGGVLMVPKGKYLFRYPVFVPSNIMICGDGIDSQIIANISIAEGRCAFVVGNSHEWNYEQTQYYRDKGIRGWLANAEFDDPTILECLTRPTQKLETDNSSIENLRITFDYTNCKSDWGGYGIQFANASNCFAKDIWTENACQAIGIGSDTPPSTPGCINIYCYNISVIKPDPVRTYYAIGFISASQNCGIINAESYRPLSSLSKDGSLISANFTKSCVFKNIKGVVGGSEVSEGLLLNNSYGTLVENLQIQNAKTGIAISFTNYERLLQFKQYRNKLTDIELENCENGIVLYSKFNDFKRFKLRNVINPLVFNINATHNSFQNFSLIEIQNKEKADWFYKNNTVSIK